MANKAELRQFIMNYFSDDELSALAFDYFPEVLNSFAAGMTKSQKVIELIGYCERRDLMDNLHAALAIIRPEPYQELIDSLPTLQSEGRSEGRDPNRIFLSHANQDAGFAHQLADDLRRHGYDIWIAPGSILPGEKWVDAIERGLETSGIFLLVMTSNAANSRWVKDESSYAIDLENKGEIRLITLDVAEGKLPPMWRVRQHIPFRQDYDEGLRQLLGVLHTRNLSLPKPVGRNLPPSPQSKILKWMAALGVFIVLLVGSIFIYDQLNSPEESIAVQPELTNTVTIVEVTRIVSVTEARPVVDEPTALPTITPQPSHTLIPTTPPTRPNPIQQPTNPIGSAATESVVTRSFPTPRGSVVRTVTPTPTSTLTPSPTPTATPELPTITPTDEVIAYEEYVGIRDESNAIYVEVPVEWFNIERSNWFDDNGLLLGSQLIASTNINAYAAGYTTPGVEIMASAILDFEGIESLPDYYDFSAVCIYDGRFPYDDSLYIGVYDQYSNCDGQGSMITVLAAEPNDQSYAIIVLVQAVTTADIDAQSHVWNTFKVVGALPGQ